MVPQLNSFKMCYFKVTAYVMLIWPQVYCLTEGLMLLKCASSLQMSFKEARGNFILLTEQLKSSCVATKRNTSLTFCLKHHVIDLHSDNTVFLLNYVFHALPRMSYL